MNREKCEHVNAHVFPIVVWLEITQHCEGKTRNESRHGGRESAMSVESVSAKFHHHTVIHVDFEFGALFLGLGLGLGLGGLAKMRLRFQSRVGP